MILTNDQSKLLLQSGITAYDVAPHRMQLVTPFDHTDGDPIEMYILPKEGHENTFILSDCGMTEMRLSYTEDLTNSLIDKIQKLVRSYRMNYEDGVISTTVNIESLPSYLYTFAMTISRVMGLQVLSSKRSINQFYENFRKLVLDLSEFNPIENFAPIKNREDTTVDYYLSVPSSEKAVHLYPVMDDSKAIDVWGRINFFLMHDLSFRSLVVCDDLTKITKRNQKRLTAESDRLLYLDDFKSTPFKIIERLIS